MPPKLTKEELKAKKEAAKLEKARLAAEAKWQERRDVLQREMAMQVVHRAAIDKSWREIMLRIKEPVLRKEIETTWHYFERISDKKDHLIQHLLKLMEIAENQYQITICGFCDIIDSNVLNFYDDLKNLSYGYELKKTALLKWGEGLRDRLILEATDAENHMQILIFHGYKSFDDNTWEKRGEYLVKEDDIRTELLDIRDALKSNLENIYNKMWDEYNAVLKQYVHDTAENQKRARKLRKKENIVADVINSQAKKLANSEKLLDNLKKELASYESGTKQAQYRDRRDRHRRAMNHLKNRFKNGNALDRKHLEALVHTSNETTDYLETLKNKVSTILRLAALCRKFETHREKVLPFGTDFVNLNLSKMSVRKPSEDCIEDETMGTSTGLSRLWQRISGAELSKRALIREKELLERENAYLLEKLRGFNEDTKIKSADEFRCVCENKPKQIHIPSAVDGNMELAKYRKYYY